MAGYEKVLKHLEKAGKRVKKEVKKAWSGGAETQTFDKMWGKGNWKWKDPDNHDAGAVQTKEKFTVGKNKKKKGVLLKNIHKHYK